ncbi:hypothetical protein [Lentzea sp. NEAU-D7]|uniref:hypothetical protein n=1 Tax=Lentzea sp. NEAU-D7 TaxID=2994667 RepID=UPI00224B172F|nr:hypothetical protein [Lentzea sp. NEAU-D7]MCX2954521.1 hypothetical protein [Lentzea sp. NEAU-D7]
MKALVWAHGVLVREKLPSHGIFLPEGKTIAWLGNPGETVDAMTVPILLAKNDSSLYEADQKTGPGFIPNYDLSPDTYLHELVLRDLQDAADAIGFKLYFPQRQTRYCTGYTQCESARRHICDGILNEVGEDYIVMANCRAGSSRDEPFHRVMQRLRKLRGIPEPEPKTTSLYQKSDTFNRMRTKLENYVADRDYTTAMGKLTAMGEAKRAMMLNNSQMIKDFWEDQVAARSEAEQQKRIQDSYMGEVAINHFIAAHTTNKDFEMMLPETFTECLSGIWGKTFFEWLKTDLTVSIGLHNLILFRQSESFCDLYGAILSLRAGIIQDVTETINNFVEPLNSSYSGAGLLDLQKYGLSTLVSLAQDLWYYTEQIVEAEAAYNSEKSQENDETARNALANAKAEAEQYVNGILDSVNQLWLPDGPFSSDVLEMFHAYLKKYPREPQSATSHEPS